MHRDPDGPAGAATSAVPTTEEVVATHRDRLIGLAYRTLGQMTEAEDAVQETFLRWSTADRERIDNPGGWLTTVCTRLCLDRLRTASRRRETYVGPWLPEPVVTDDLDLTDGVAMGETLTLAFLVLLESLSPLERVAFLLHDVFGFGHDEVGRMLERTPAATRQLVSRARRHVTEGRVGADRVARFLVGMLRKAPPDAEARPVVVNGMPGIVGLVDGRAVTVIVVDVADGRVTAVRAIRNPDKLRSFDLEPDAVTTAL